MKTYFQKNVRYFVCIIILISNIFTLYLLNDITKEESLKVEEKNFYISSIKNMFINKSFEDISSFENNNFIVTVQQIDKTNEPSEKRITVIDKKTTSSLYDTSSLIIKSESPNTIYFIKKGEPDYINLDKIFSFQLLYWGIAGLEFLLCLFILPMNNNFCIYLIKFTFFIIPNSLLESNFSLSLENVILISFCCYLLLLVPIYIHGLLTKTFSRDRLKKLVIQK